LGSGLGSTSYCVDDERSGSEERDCVWDGERSCPRRSEGRLVVVRCCRPGCDAIAHSLVATKVAVIFRDPLSLSKPKCKDVKAEDNEEEE
jgi:hypothetical protein